MALHAANQTNSTPSDLSTTKCNSKIAINHLFGPDGIILGITYSTNDCGLTEFNNSINYQGKLDSNSSCTII